MVAFLSAPLPRGSKYLYISCLWPLKKPQDIELFKARVLHVLYRLPSGFEFPHASPLQALYASSRNQGFSNLRCMVALVRFECAARNDLLMCDLDPETVHTVQKAQVLSTGVSTEQTVPRHF